MINVPGKEEGRRFLSPTFFVSSWHMCINQPFIVVPLIVYFIICINSQSSSVMFTCMRHHDCRLLNTFCNNMMAGGARSKIGRLMQELGRLQQIRKPGNLSTSSSIISEMVKVGPPPHVAL